LRFRDEAAALATDFGLELDFLRLAANEYVAPEADDLKPKSELGRRDLRRLYRKYEVFQFTFSYDLDEDEAEEYAEGIERTRKWKPLPLD
jgi:Mn-dependent DtxR family transcriptional regulator